MVWVVRPTHLLGFAAKWDGERETQAFVLPDFPSFKKNPHCDKALLGRLYEILSECDIAAAHNGDRFDLRVIRARLLINGFPPLPHFKQVDTLKWARSVFKFDSARLDAICQATGLGRKLPTKNNLWRRCDEGDLKAFETMRRYNRHDVVLLQKAHDLIRPWVPNGPNMAVYMDRKHACPSCGSYHVVRNGTRVLTTRKYRRMNCQECGHWFKGEIVK